MKYSLGISNFLEEIFSLSHSIVFSYFFALITEEVFLNLAILWNSAFKWVCLSISSLPLTFNRNGMDLTEAEDIKKKWQEYTEELYKNFS